MNFCRPSIEQGMHRSKTEPMQKQMPHGVVPCLLLFGTDCRRKEIRL
jgi:hypothetical protein